MMIVNTYTKIEKQNDRGLDYYSISVICNDEKSLNSLIDFIDKNTNSQHEISCCMCPFDMDNKIGDIFTSNKENFNGKIDFEKSFKKLVSKWKIKNKK